MVPSLVSNRYVICSGIRNSKMLTLWLPLIFAFRQACLWLLFPPNQKYCILFYSFILSECYSYCYIVSINRHVMLCVEFGFWHLPSLSCHCYQYLTSLEKVHIMVDLVCVCPYISLMRYVVCILHVHRHNKMTVHEPNIMFFMLADKTNYMT